MTSADWELDFYSRPILEADGRKRWELLITSTPTLSDQDTPFRFIKCCPSGEVNSLWLTQALQDAGAALLAQLHAHDGAAGRRRTQP